MSISVFISAPISLKDAVNTALETAGFGPGNLNVPYRGSTRLNDDQPIEDATDFGCHWWIERQDIATVIEVVKAASPDAIIVANLNEEESAELGVAGLAESSDKAGFELADSQAGDYFYIPVDPRLIEGLTKGLYALTNAGRDGRYARIIDPLNGQWPVLEFRENDIVPIHLRGNSTPLTQVLQGFVAGGGLTQRELSTIVNGVQAAAGSAVRIRDFIPASWERYIMSKEQFASYAETPKT